MCISIFERIYVDKLCMSCKSYGNTAFLSDMISFRLSLVEGSLQPPLKGSLAPPFKGYTRGTDQLYTLHQALIGALHQALIGDPINRGPINRMSPSGDSTSTPQNLLL